MKVPKQIKTELLFEILEQYDNEYGDYPESMQEGKAIKDYIIEYFEGKKKTSRNNK